MFAGHVGAGLVFARMERRVNAGAFIAAALLLDIILWSLRAPRARGGRLLRGSRARRTSPSSRSRSRTGCSPSLMWSVVAGGLLFAASARLGAGSPAAARVRTRAAWLAGAAVFSHWLLDALVHRPELPVAGSLRAGLGPLGSPARGARGRDRHRVLRHGGVHGGERPASGPLDRDRRPRAPHAGADARGDDRGPTSALGVRDGHELARHARHRVRLRVLLGRRRERNPPRASAPPRLEARARPRPPGAGSGVLVGPAARA